MPAPPTALIEAMRAGSAARHVFFKLQHPSGTIRAWDGVGERIFAGETYLGVYGFAEIGGVSNTSDIQNHQVVAKLNRVALAGLTAIDFEVRNVAAAIHVAWITEDGTQIDSYQVFSGLADYVAAHPTEHWIAVYMRGKLAEWRTPPRAYYTDADQKRSFPTDTGFSFVKGLENATVTGWSNVAESSGGDPTAMSFRFGAADYRALHSAGSLGGIIGEHTNGVTPGLVADADTTPQAVRRVGGSLTPFVEETSGASVVSLAGGIFTVGGVNCYIDTAGDVRSPAGLMIWPAAGSSTSRARMQGAIATVGVATATTVSTVTISGLTYMIKTGGSLAGNSQTDLVYCNEFGRYAQIVSATPRPVFGMVAGTPDLTSQVYKEEGTGTAVAISAGLLKVGGSNCVVSDTGVILTPLGNRITLEGVSGSDAFLRVWT